MNFIQLQQFPIAINVEIKHENVAQPTIFNCAFCNQTFQTRKQLKDHKSREHQQISETRTKKNKTETSNQIRSYVIHQPKFQCEYCFKGFDQSHRLKQHQISHREPIYECDQVCFCMFSTKFHHANSWTYSATRNLNANTDSSITRTSMLRVQHRSVMSATSSFQHWFGFSNIKLCTMIRFTTALNATKASSANTAWNTTN